MILIWILLGLCAVGGALLLASHRKREGQPKALPVEGRTLLTVQVNDIITHFDRDYLVDGKLSYDEDGRHWSVYMLVDGDDVMWLSVKGDDRVGVIAYAEREDMDVGSEPAPVQMVDGVRFELTQRGTADVQSVGATGKPQRATVATFDYEGPGGKCLHLERRGEQAYDVLVGRSLIAAEFDILPGDDVD